MVDLGIRSTVGTGKALDIQEEISWKCEVNVLTETIDDIPSLAKACATFEQEILAYAGMSPSTYQSGQLTSSYAHMEKRGSRF